MYYSVLCHKVLKNSNCPKFPLLCTRTRSSTCKSWQLNPLLPLDFVFSILSLEWKQKERKKDGPENCEKWASCCLKAIKYTSAKCHLEVESHKFCPFVGATRRQNQGCRKLPKAGWVSGKVEKIQEDSLDSIPSPSVKIQIIGGKVYWRQACAKV